MKFKAKLFKLGNSRGIYIPKEVYTYLEDKKEYEWEVYTDLPAGVYTKPLEFQTPKTKKPKFNTQWCKSHNVMKGTCGCE